MIGREPVAVMTRPATTPPSCARAAHGAATSAAASTSAAARESVARQPELGLERMGPTLIVVPPHGTSSIVRQANDDSTRSRGGPGKKCASQVRPRCTGALPAARWKALIAARNVGTKPEITPVYHSYVTRCAQYFSLMSRHTGIASLPLHTGKAPPWLF